MALRIESYEAVIFGTIVTIETREKKLVPFKGEVIKFLDGTYLESTLWFVHVPTSPCNVSAGNWTLLDLRTASRVALGESRQDVLLKGHARILERVPTKLKLLSAQRALLRTLKKDMRDRLEAQFLKHLSIGT